MQSVLSDLMFTAILKSQRSVSSVGCLEDLVISQCRPGLSFVIQNLVNGEPDSGTMEIYRLPTSTQGSLRWRPAELWWYLTTIVANYPGYSLWLPEPLRQSIFLNSSSTISNILTKLRR